MQPRKKRRVGLDSNEEIKNERRVRDSGSERSMIDISESILEDCVSKISNTPVASNRADKRLNKQVKKRRLKRLEETIAERLSIDKKICSIC